VSKSDLKVRVFQICSTDSFKVNIKKIESLLQTHAKKHEFCLFPENALYINIDKKSKTPDFDLKDLDSLRALCKTKKVTVSLGSAPLYEEGKLFNTMLFIDEEGELTKPYKKIHLFRAEVGRISVNEGDQYTSGEKPAIIEVKGWKVGLSICFDLRFSDLYSYYAKQGCDLILVPSAFLRPTGAAHWEVLLRARAIETQSYVIASAQEGVHKSDTGSIRKSYGHSMAVSPWGDVLINLKDKEDVSEVVTLKESELKKMRSSLIMDRHLLKI
jgi:predicted amidohydrolase